MNRKLVTLAIATLLLFGGRMAGADDELSPPETVLTSADRIDGKAIMDLICAARADSALTVLREDRYAKSSDPLVFLLTARAMRDQMSDEDDNKDLIKADTEPIIKILEHAAELCDRALDQKSADPMFYYYRGRANLAKAQMHVLTRGYWSAGRSAASAKGDLEHFLDIQPDNADAQGDLGAFLYFADTLPGVVKFISKMLFIPGGDRERGLQMLHYAATHDGTFVVDYQIALAAIDLIFEGRFERGATAMEALIDKYPYYTRLVEPFGVMAPLYPTRIREFERLEDRTVGRHMAQGTVDWSLVKRMQLHRSYLNMFFGTPQTAYFELTSLVDNPVSRPDWMLPLAMINLAHLQAKGGQVEEARSALEHVLENDAMSHYHDLAGDLLSSMKDHPWKTVDLGDLDFIASIYNLRLSAAREGLAAYRARYGTDVLYYFYLGELELLAENFVASARAYGNCLGIEVYGGDQTYQMFACMRIGEMHGHEGRYKEAREFFEQAKSYTHAGYLFDFMLAARTHFYELLEEGTITAQPSLLLQQSMTPQNLPLSDNR